MTVDNTDEYVTKISQPQSIEEKPAGDMDVVKVSPASVVESSPATEKVVVKPAQAAAVEANPSAESIVVKSAQPAAVSAQPPAVPQQKLWFGLQRWVVIAVAAGILILLFAPLFAVTKVINTTETIMTTVTTEQPETVTTPTKIKVYTGWMKVSDQSSGSYYQPPIIIWNNPYPRPGPGPLPPGPFYSQQQQQQQVYPSYYYPYNNYGSGTVTTIKVDYSDEIVDVKYVNASNNLWDISLIGRDGKEKVVRNVSEYDLTKTGDITVDITETKTKTISNQVPQQVNKQVPVQMHVGLFQLIFGLY